MTRGWATRNGSTRGPGEDEAAQRPDGHDVGDRRLAEEDRHLAEEVAATEPGALRPVDDDGRLAVEDHVEPGAGQALAEDPLALARRRPPRTVWTMPSSCGVGRSANSAKRRSRRRAPRGRPWRIMVPDVHARCDRPWRMRSRAPVDGPRVERRSMAGPAHVEERMTLTRDRRTRAAGGGAACSPASTPTGWTGSPTAAVEVDFPADHVIARQGEIGTGFFVIVVRRASASSATARRSRTLGPGEFFGELSVLDGRPRVAQVIADGPTTLPRPRVLGLRGGPRSRSRRSRWRSCAGWPPGCAT